MAIMVDEPMIRRYLLGELVDEEQQSVERRLLIDDQCFVELERVEEELIDQYARGELSSADRRRFEDHFLTTPGRRESVEFAKAFYACAANSVSAPERTSRSDPVSLRTLLFTISSGRRAVLVALLVFVALLSGAVITWLFIEVGRLQKRLDQAQEQLSSLEQQDQALRTHIHEQLARSERMAQDLEREQKESARIQRELLKLKTGGTTVAGSEVVVFSVLPGLSRTDQETPSVTLSPATRRIQLQLRIDEPVYDRYLAELQTPELDTVWVEKDLKAAPDESSVIMSLPVRLIDRSDYLISLSGAGPDGAYEVLETYHFRVIKK